MNISLIIIVPAKQREEMASRKKGTKKDNYASSSEDEEQELASRSAPVPKSDGLPQVIIYGRCESKGNFSKEINFMCLI